MITANDLHWAAGFIDGDGCVGHTRTTPMITATQKDRWPLEKLVSLFGGTIYRHVRDEAKGHIYYRWDLYGNAAAGVLMTLYVLLSPRRQAKIRDVVERWKFQAKGSFNAKKTHCKRGHEFTEENTYVKPLGGRQCRSCQSALQRSTYMNRKD